MSFFGLLKKKKKFDETHIESTLENEKDTNMMNDSLKSDPIAAMLAGIPDDNRKNPATMNTYDILVFEQGNDGSKKQRMVSGVKAYSAQDLARMYSADGAQIQILKEYPGMPEPSQIAKSDVKALLPSTPPPRASIAQPPIEQKEQNFVQKQDKLPPKFFEIGGVKCKLDGGKMYQEQWVRVDSSKYRLISDASNKVVPTTGKHIETLKWVMIEDNEESNSKEIENA